MFCFRSDRESYNKINRYMLLQLCLHHVVRTEVRAVRWQSPDFLLECGTTVLAFLDRTARHDHICPHLCEVQRCSAANTCNSTQRINQ